MAARKPAARHRVGRVSYYQHHGSWYLYYRDNDGPQRPRIGRSEFEAERAAAVKNAELTTGDIPESVNIIAALSPHRGGGIDRRSLAASAVALLGDLIGLGQGLQANQILPAVPATTVDVSPPTEQPVTSVVQLREEFLEHHEHVLASALTTVDRYDSATRHLLDFAKQENVAEAANISASKFTRYLRNIEVAANGHPNASRHPLSEKSICLTLQTCGSMYRLGVENGLLPKSMENPFRLRGLRKLKMRRSKPIFVFDAQTESKFFEAADPWSFAVHFVLAKTGLRPGELVHTLIEDLDFEQGWLRVRGKSELGWNVKTGTDRDVPLAPEVIHVLQQVIGRRTVGPVFLRIEITSDSRPVLTGDRTELTRTATRRIEQRCRELGRKVTRREEAVVLHGVWRDSGAVRADRIRNSLIRVAKRIGVDATCPKSWRHTFATLLQEANVDLLIRQITLGHQPARPEQSALGMTGVYTHTRPEVQHREILRALQLRRTVLDLAGRR